MLREILIDQIKKQLIDGLAHSYCIKTRNLIKPYPEVTGYIIQLFAIRNMHGQLVEEMSRKVCEYQNETGAFRTFYDSRGYLFDTGVILRGLIAADKFGVDGLTDNINNAYKFICTSGEHDFWYSDKKNVRDYCSILVGNQSWSWGHTPINLKLAEALIDYDRAYLSNIPSTALCTNLYESLNRSRIEYTHPGAYQLEGLYALGKLSDMKSFFDNVFLSRFENGFISYASYLDYEYTSGTIQLGIIAYFLGYEYLARKVYERFSLVISKYGLLPQYLDLEMNLAGPHAECNVWGMKYLIELEELLFGS